MKVEKMADEPGRKYFEFGARVLMPAIVTSLALYFAGLPGAQATQLNLVAFLAAYLVGYTALEYAGSELKIKRDYGFYVLFAVLAIAGGLVAGGLLSRTPGESANSIILPLTVAFALPAAFEIVRERIKSVQPG